MPRSVGIPGCGIPVKGPKKTLKVHSHQGDVKDKFSYNLKGQLIPYDTTDIYFSLPDTQLPADINIPGAFMKDINEEVVSSPIKQNKGYDKGTTIGGGLDTRKEETPRSTPVFFKTSKYSSIVQDSQIYQTASNIVDGFNGFNDSYNFLTPFDFGARNNNLSTSSSKEISHSFNKTFIPIYQKSKNNIQKKGKIRTRNPTVPTTGPLGKWNSLAYPWEKGIGNSVISTSSAREISYQTKKSTTAIPQPFIPMSKASPDIFYDASSLPINPLPSKNVLPNLVSSNTGSQISFSSTPWEMGFDNRKLSTSSIREIATRFNRTVLEIPVTSKKRSPKVSKERYNIAFSNIGAIFSFDPPWEMGFNNRPVSNSSIREISNSFKSTVFDIPQNYHIYSNSKKNTPHGKNMFSKQNTRSLMSENPMSMGYGSGMSLSTPNVMGFHNIQMSSSSIQEIFKRPNVTVLECPQGCTFSPLKGETLKDTFTKNHFKLRNANTPVSFGATLGSEKHSTSPQDIGFANQPQSISNLNEISPISKEKINFPSDFLFLDSVLDKSNKKDQNLETNVLSISLKNTVGSNVASQGPSFSKLYPPLGIKGLVKSFSEIYSSPKVISNQEGNGSNELQEPLESAFMPLAITTREFKGNILLHGKPTTARNATSGKYNLLLEDLQNSRMTTNVFGTNLKTLQTENLLDSKKDNKVSYLDIHTGQAVLENKPSSEKQRLLGDIVALSSLPIENKTVNTTTLKEHVYQLNPEIKPKQNELIALDSLLVKNKTTEKSRSSSVDLQSTPFKTTSSEYKKEPLKENGYWNSLSDLDHTLNLQGTMQSIKRDQKTRRTNRNVSFNNPTVRRGSLGSITNPKGMGCYPSLIDPYTPTYGFKENAERTDLLATNEYYSISDPVAEASDKRLSISNEPPSTNLFDISDTLRKQAFRLEQETDESRNATSVISRIPFQETLPRSFVNSLGGTERPTIHKQRPRRKSNVSNIFDKFTQAVTKSTI